MVGNSKNQTHSPEIKLEPHCGETKKRVGLSPGKIVFFLHVVMISSFNFQLRVQCIPPDGATPMSSHVYHGPLQIGTQKVRSSLGQRASGPGPAHCGGDLAKARLKRGCKDW